MTKILLVIVVLATIVLMGLSVYESYRSVKEASGQTSEQEFEDFSQVEATGSY